MTERIKERMAQLRLEADTAITRAEDAEAKVKRLEQEILDKDMQINSFQHQLGLAEETNTKLEDQLGQYKSSSLEGEQSRTTSENLQRKVQLLEEELDAAEKNVKETVEKLRQVDVKAEHFERQVQRAEQERDAWEQKYEALDEKYKKSQAELDELEKSMQDL